jgi:hypothetical protein
VAAARWGRNGIGIEIEPRYIEHAERRLRRLHTDEHLRMDVEVASSPRPTEQSFSGPAPAQGLPYQGAA